MLHGWLSVVLRHYLLLAVGNAACVHGLSVVRRLLVDHRLMLSLHATFGHLILAFLELLDELSQRRKLPLVDQVKLIDEVDEVLEARVEMRLSLQQHDVLEVRVVDVRIDPE